MPLRTHNMHFLFINFVSKIGSVLSICFPTMSIFFPTCITIDRDQLEIVSEFCYLGDVIGRAGGCTDTKSARIGSTWKAFHELLPILTNKGMSLVNRGKVFNACIRKVVLYGKETWPLSTEDLSRIKRCEHAMIRWLCNVKIEQKYSTVVLRRRIHVHYIDDILRWNRLRLSGRLYRQETSWTKKIMNFNVDGPTSRGRPKLRWKDIVNADLRKKHLNTSLTNDRSKWRNAIRQVTQQIPLQPTRTINRLRKILFTCSGYDIFINKGSSPTFSFNINRI